MLAIAIGLAQVLFFAPVSAHDSDVQQITAVMKQLFEKPGAPLTVAPVSVDGDYAVASWAQGGRGGRAFLQKENKQWAITVCGGAGLTLASAKQSIGLQAQPGHGASAKK